MNRRRGLLGVHAFFTDRPELAARSHEPPRDRKGDEMSDTNTLKKVERLIAPIVSDLHLDLYDLEFRGGTLRVTIDRPAGVDEGLDLEAIALALAPDRPRARPRRPDGRPLHAGGHQSRASSAVCARPATSSDRSARRWRCACATSSRPTASAASAACRVCWSPPTTSRQRSSSTMRRSPSERCPTTRSTGPETVFVWGPAPKPGKAPSETKTGAEK